MSPIFEQACVLELIDENTKGLWRVSLLGVLQPKSLVSAKPVKPSFCETSVWSAKAEDC